MAISKSFRNGMLFLAVCLGLLVLNSGLAPAYAAAIYAVGVGGGSENPWGPPTQVGVSPQKINGGEFFIPPHLGILL